jgi:hypothetical protein
MRAWLESVEGVFGLDNRPVATTQSPQWEALAELVVFRRMRIDKRMQIDKMLLNASQRCREKAALRSKEAEVGQRDCMLLM